MHGDGPHAGDLPNLHVPEGGVLSVEILADELALDADDADTLLDGDGAPKA